MLVKGNNWDNVISPKKAGFRLNYAEIWRFRDLLKLFVWRDFVSVYKQTVLGPLWFFIQPLLTTLTFTIIFGNVAKVSTNGQPQILFYMAGITIWNYFADCVDKTSSTFTKNQSLFGKVYFPRIILPLAVILNNLMKFGIQFLLLTGFWLYYYFVESSNIQIQWTILILPMIILTLAMIGLGTGMIISALTTKYRDLTFLVTFGIQLFMYASPIVYPLSTIPSKYTWLVLLNPMTSLIEFFKYSILGNGFVSVPWLLYSLCISVITLILGTVIFNRVEKSFIDTV